MKNIALKVVIGLGVIGGSLFANNHAVVIGCCSEYKYLKGVEPLYGTTNDAKAMRDILVNTQSVPKKNIVMLIEKNATHKNIVDTLKSLLNKKDLKKGDKVYIYYSGHGSNPFDKKGYFGKKIRNNKKLLKWINNSTALVPYDVNPKNNKKLLKTLLITKRDIKPILQKLDKKGVDVIWIVDACFAGNAYRSANKSSVKTIPFSLEDTIPTKKSKIYYNNLLFFSASLTTLPTSESTHNGKKRGDFTYILEKCLTMPTSSGYITKKDLTKCLNANFSNTQIIPNYYPLDNRLDDKIVLKTTKKGANSSSNNYKELLFKLQNDKPLLEVSIKSLDSSNEVIGTFCKGEELEIRLDNNDLKYVLAFTKDKDGKVIMLQPDAKNPMRGNKIVETEVIPPFGRDEVKIFATNDVNIYRVAKKFANKEQGVLSTPEIEEIYRALKKSGNFRTANLTVETIDKDVSECIKGD